MYKLSIIVVTWNCRKYVPEFFESLGQILTDHAVQTIVVDNASTDGTPELIRELFPTINLIRNQKNLGFAKANNIGLRQSSGEFIALINPDVKVLAGCVERMMELLRTRSDVGLVGPMMLGRDELAHRSIMRFPSVWNSFCNAIALDVVFPNSSFFGGYLMRDSRYDKTMEVDVLNGWFWMTRRTAFSQVGLLDERFFMYGEDIDWCRRYSAANLKLVYLAEASSIHYGGGSSSNSPVRFYIEKQRANLQYFEKHHGPFERFGFLFCVYLYHINRVVGHGVSYMLPGFSRDEVGSKMKRSLATLRWLLGLSPHAIGEDR